MQKILTLLVVVFADIIHAGMYNPPVGELSSLDTRVQAAQATADAALSYGDGATIKKSGSIFSVQPWITDNLTELRFETWNHWQTQSRGLLDGPGYWFSDQNGIITNQSSGYTYSSGYKNQTLVEGEGNTNEILHYKLNDNAATTIVQDSIGTNTGVATENTDGLSTTGKINTAIDFDGNNTAIDCVSASITPLGAGPFTVALWIKTAVGAPAYDAIFQLGLDTNTRWFSCYLEDSQGGKVGLDANGSGGLEGRVLSDTSITDGSWHHLVVIDTVDYFKMYIDGVFQGSNAITMAATDGSTFRLGANAGHNKHIVATFDDVRIYSYVLPDTDIALVYNSGNGTEAALSLVATNMTLTVTNSLLSFVPASTYASALINVGTETIAPSNVTLSVSRDGGTTWSTAPATIMDSWDVSNKLVVANISMTNQPVGSNVFPRIYITNGCPAVTVKSVAMPCGE